MDEMMEMITLIQTGKTTKKMKIVVYDEEFWKNVINFDTLIEYGTISKSDMKIMTFCNTVDEAFEEITSHFKKYYIKNGIKKK